MPFSPLSLLLGWLIGPASLAALGFSIFVLWEWVRLIEDMQSHLPGAGHTTSAAIAAAQSGWGAGVIIACALWALWSVLGRFVVLAFFRRGQDEPRSVRRGTHAKLTTKDGVRLHVEIEGPEKAPALVMTHGWGLDSTAWYYLRQHLSSRFRLVTWDLPGLGRSALPTNKDFTVEHLATYLHEVIASVNGPVLLLGHSIGGMTILTLCRRFPDMMNSKVVGAVLVDTTYTKPLNTILASWLLKLLDRPVIRPLLYLTIWLAPLVWFWNFLSYLNGCGHLITCFTSFSSAVTRGQLQFATWFTIKDDPEVLARGLLALLRWDETATLPTISLPVGIVVGGDDRITLPRASKEMLRLIPRARLTTITPAGHTGLLEQGGRYSEAVAEWVQAAVPPFGFPPAGDESPAGVPHWMRRANMDSWLVSVCG